MPQSARPRKPYKPPTAPPDFAFKIDGVVYRVFLDEVSAKTSMRLRRECGWSVQGLAREAIADADIDVIAALAFLARVQEGDDTVTFDEVAEKVTYKSSIVQLDADGNEVDVDPGEAPGAS